MYDINTIEELIEELGGPSVLAHALDMSQSAVSQWIVRQNIPGGWHMRLYSDVCQRGKSVAPKVFDLTEDQFAPLAVARPASRPRAFAQ